MEENESPMEKPARVSPTKMSKTPSWIMLGFVLGALFVWALPPQKVKTPARSEIQVAATEPPKTIIVQQPRISTIEAVFEEWGAHAVWSDDATEVALWNSELRSFSDFFEVRRIAGKYYFRSIPRLTRRVIRHGKEIPESPLQFTETEEQYQEWRQHGRTERPPERADYRPVRPSAPTSDTRARTVPPAASPELIAPPPLERVAPLPEPVAPGAGTKK